MDSAFSRLAADEYSFGEASRGHRRSEDAGALHAMMECYFDDSSDPRREKYMACGGLMGSSDHWDSFDMLWSDATHGLKEPFRATDCECGYGQFSDAKKWPKPKRDALMAKLTGIIDWRGLYGFAAIVPIEEYNAAFPNCGKYDALLLASTQAIMNMAYIAHQVGKDASLWFESGPRIGTVEAIFHSVRAFVSWSPANHLRRFTSETKKIRPLQAADFVAREAFKYMDNRGLRPTRKPLRVLEDVLCFIVWTSEALEYLARNGGRENLELLSAWDTRRAPRFRHFWKEF